MDVIKRRWTSSGVDGYYQASMDVTIPQASGDETNALRIGEDDAIMVKMVQSFLTKRIN